MLYSVNAHILAFVSQIDVFVRSESLEESTRTKCVIVCTYLSSLGSGVHCIKPMTTTYLPGIIIEA